MATRPDDALPEAIASDLTASDWLDRMTEKLFIELGHQLDRIAKARPTDARARAADARTLLSLQQTLERLAKLERERGAVREKKVAKHDENARAALERRLDKLLAASAAQKPAGKSG
jgi:hypothetical protein